MINDVPTTMTAAQAARTSSGTQDKQTTCLIHAQMTAEQGSRRLESAVKSSTEQPDSWKTMYWLIRESSKAGCLTIDFVQKKGNDVRYPSIRCMMIKGSDNRIEWMIPVTDESYEQNIDKAMVAYQNFKDANAQNENIAALLKTVSPKGFGLNALLIPNELELVRNNGYSVGSEADHAYLVAGGALSTVNTCSSTIEKVQLLFEALKPLIDGITNIKQALEDLGECPISAKELAELETLTLTADNHLYDSCALGDWLSRNPTNPMTRRPLQMSDTLSTNMPVKLNQIKEKCEQKIEHIKLKISDLLRNGDISDSLQHDYQTRLQSLDEPTYRKLPRPS